jgi:hypothetical protein
MKKPAILILLILITIMMVQGQSLSCEVIGSGSVWSMGLDGSFSSTIGEVITETHYGEMNTLTQGFHQPEEQVFGLEDLMKQITFEVYPNPAGELLYADFSPGNAAVRMFVTLNDLYGRVIFRKEVTEGINSFDLQGLSPGFYLLELSSERTSYCSFKIMKY